MTATLHFDDARLRDDLATYFGRAGRIEDGAVRVQELPATSGRPAAVACWVPVLRPMGILDTSPLVIGVRAFPATITGVEDADRHDGALDVVVPLRGFLDRLARTPATDDEARELPLPPDRRHEAWTGRRPPLTGWQQLGPVDTAMLIRVAEEGIARVGEASGGGMLGQIQAERVRTEVWTAPLFSLDGQSADASADVPPAGASFAAHALGFLRADELAQLAVSTGWWRLATPAGQVLVQRRASAASNGN